MQQYRPSAAESFTMFVYAVAVVIVCVVVAAVALGQPTAKPFPKNAAVTEHTEGRAKLGEKLFFDPILSDNGKVSCSTCHSPDHAFASKGKPPSLRGGTLEIDSPSLVNVSLGRGFFRDGRSPSLEDQVIGPITNPAEMGSSMPAVIRRLKDKPEYVKLFDEHYKTGINERTITDAIANFERTLIIPHNAKLAKYLRGAAEHTMTVEEIRGFNIFRGKGHCYKCHTGDTFSDYDYHNTGISTQSKLEGRRKATGRDADLGKWKTPGLIGVSLSAPYMHNGQYSTLENVIEFYNLGGFQNRNLDPEMKRLRLTEQEKADLLAFLKML